MNGLELFLLGRRLTKIGEDAIPRSGFHQLSPSVRSVMIDAFEHPGSSVKEIVARTGSPQSQVSASVAKLRDAGILTTTADPMDRRRTLVRQSPDIPARAARIASTPVDDVLGAAIGSDDAQEVSHIVAVLETLAQRLTSRSDVPPRQIR